MRFNSKVLKNLGSDLAVFRISKSFSTDKTHVPVPIANKLPPESRKTTKSCPASPSKIFTDHGNRIVVGGFRIPSTSSTTFRISDSPESSVTMYTLRDVATRNLGFFRVCVENSKFPPNLSILRWPNRPFFIRIATWRCVFATSSMQSSVSMTSISEKPSAWISTRFSKNLMDPNHVEIVCKQKFEFSERLLVNLHKKNFLKKNQKKKIFSYFFS